MEGNEATPGVTVAKISNGNTWSACVRAIMTRLKQRIFATDKTYHQPKCSIKWTETQTYNTLVQQVCVQLSTYTDKWQCPHSPTAHCCCWSWSISPVHWAHSSKQVTNGTDRRTLYHFIHPARHTMWTVKIIKWSLAIISVCWGRKFHCMLEAVSALKRTRMRRPSTGVIVSTLDESWLFCTSPPRPVCYRFKHKYYVTSKTIIRLS